MDDSGCAPDVTVKPLGVLLDVEALALQVEPLAGDAEVAGGILDAMSVEAQRLLDHRAFEMFHGGGHRLVGAHDQLRGVERAIGGGEGAAAGRDRRGEVRGSVPRAMVIPPGVPASVRPRRNCTRSTRRRPGLAGAVRLE